MDERVQLAYEQLFGDPALTDALTDDVAQGLLAWARAQIDCWVRQMPVAEAEAAGDSLAIKIQALRRIVRRIAQQSAAAPDPRAAVQAYLERLDATAPEETL